MVTRCDTSKVKGLQVGPSAKNAHIAGKEQQQLCLHFSVQKLFSSHNGSLAYNGWMDLLVPGGQGTRTASLFALQGSPFTFQHSRATPRKHMRHNQEVRNRCWYASKCSSAMSCPNNTTLKKNMQNAKLSRAKMHTGIQCLQLLPPPSIETVFGDGLSIPTSQVVGLLHAWITLVDQLLKTGPRILMGIENPKPDLGWGVYLYMEIMGL